MEVEKEFSHETKIRVLLSIFEANILKRLLEIDKHFEGRFKKNLLYLLKQHLDEIAEGKKRAKANKERK